MLLVTNLLPLALYYWLLVGLIERWGQTDWGKILAVAAASWGTYLTTFVVTLNNHLPAAICTLIALHVFISIWYDDERRARYFFIAGLAAALAAANELPALSLVGLLGLALLWKDWWRTLCFGLPPVVLVAAAFFGTNFVAHDTWIPPYAQRDPDNNWYDYEGSHWRPENRTGIDRGEPSRPIYAAHSLVGHHGVFSLTPMWCLSMVGILLLMRGDRETSMPALAIGIAVLSIVCMTFYLLRPEIDRKYGGVCSGFRWMFWFTPLWLFTMLPALDGMADFRARRCLAYSCLAVSVFSASYPSANPWQHPWPYEVLQYVGWI
jgi:hypothetical protein